MDQHLQKIPVKKDDLFFVEAATIHAIGAGTLLVEIQENSNLTYRMYDYDRIDKDGKKRTLQIEKAFDVANRKARRSKTGPADASVEVPKRMRIRNYSQDVSILRFTVST